MSEAMIHRVGVLGAGQLALMLAEAAHGLGVQLLCAGQKGDCAEQAAPVLQVDLSDASAVAAFAGYSDVVTVESENIDAAVLQGLPLRPNARAIGIAQDRLAEKRFLEECGIAVAPYAPVDDPASLERAVAAVGLPAILKTRRMGYDGRGQVRLQAREDLSAAWDAVGRVPCILEGHVAFEAEASLIAARGVAGETVFYPLVENVHREGILRVSTAPYSRDAATLQPVAEAYMRAVLERLEYIGVLTIEFFVQAGRLIANEMAPRVHNSGHWTIEGSATSQFENHLRAITGRPLGSTASRPTVMLNCIGTMPGLEETRGFASLARHDYGKESRPGRKLGHLTFPAEAQQEIAEWRRRLESSER